MSAAPAREGSWAVPQSVAARLAAIREAARPSEDNERPTLALIHGGTAPRRTIPFIVVVSLLLVVGLIGLLVLNTTLAQGSFTLNDLQKRSALLADEQQQLTQIVAVAQSPQQLAAQANKLGMVPEPNPVFITTNGKVLGVATPARKKVVKPKAAAASPTAATAAPAATTAPTVAATSPATNQPTSTPSPGTR